MSDFNPTMSAAEKFQTQTTVDAFNKTLTVNGRKASNELGKDDFLKILIAQLSNQEEWFQDKDGRRVPVIIYDPSQNVKPVTSEVFGGQIDLMPTLLYLLGIPSEQYDKTCIGRNLLNTSRSYAIINNGSIKGEENLTDEEKAIVSKSLDISDKMIRSNYNPYLEN